MAGRLSAVYEGLQGGIKFAVKPGQTVLLPAGSIYNVFTVGDDSKVLAANSVADQGFEECLLVSERPAISILKALGTPWQVTSFEDLNNMPNASRIGKATVSCVYRLNAGVMSCIKGKDMYESEVEALGLVVGALPVFEGHPALGTADKVLRFKGRWLSAMLWFVMEKHPAWQASFRKGLQKGNRLARSRW